MYSFFSSTASAPSSKFLSFLQNRKNLGILLIVLSGVLYGSLGVCGTWLLQEGFSVSGMLFWRFAGAAFTLPLLGVSQLGFLRNGLKMTALRNSMVNALLYSASSSLYFIASKSIGTGLGMVIFYSYPVFIFLWLWLFGKQSISKVSWFSLFLVCVGLLCLNQDLGSVGGGAFGILLAVASCLAYAGYILLSKRQTQSVNPVATTFILCLMSAVYFFLLMVAEDRVVWPQTLKNGAIVLALGFLATALPIYLMLKGLQYVNADQAAILSVFEPVVTVVLGAAFLSERVTPLQMLGICVILFGAMTSSLGNRPKLRKFSVETVNISTSGL